VREQDVARCLDGFHAVLSIESDHLHVQSTPDRGKVRLAVELDRVDALDVRLTIVRRQLVAEQSSRDGEAVVRPRQNGVAPETEGRLVRAARHHRAFDAQPVLLEGEGVVAVVEAERQIVPGGGAKGSAEVGPARHLNSGVVENGARPAALQLCHEQPAVG